jgi:hypothetical protein
MPTPDQRHLYGYVILPGNNSTAIESALKKRNVWQPFNQEK